MVLIIQCVILCLLIAVIVFWGLYFPYPSPVIQRLLPARKRWPERQIREWLQSGRFQHSFLNYFYRDPERIPPPGVELLAPADGLVTGIELRNGIRYVVIALSFWDMHVQRSPVTGKVVKVEPLGSGFMDGEGRELAFLKAKPSPVQTRIVIRSDWGDIAVRLITSLAARRIEVWVSEGNAINRGQRIGRILLGSTVVLELPPELRVLPKLGERVRAGETAIAKPAVAA